MTTDLIPQALTSQIVNEYYQLPHASSHVLSNTPWIELLVDPTTSTVSIAVDATEELVIPPDLQTLRILRLNVGRGPIDRLSVATSIDDWVAVTFLASVVNIVSSGQTLSAALTIATEAHRALLETTPEANALRLVVGLFGEVCVLRELSIMWGPEIALESWHGPEGAEHDFIRDGYSAEVKTTLSEKRRHVIGSLRQLEPTLMLPLALVSVRITDNPHGQTLPELLDAVASEFGDLGIRFQVRANTVSIRNGSSAMKRKFVLRDHPMQFWVGDDFQPLTQRTITSALVDSSSITSVSYVLDLEGKTGRELGSARSKVKGTDEL